MEFITDLFHYTFLPKALLMSVVVGILCGVIGAFIILRGLSLMGDAISHAVTPGIGAAFMFGATNYFFGALISGILAALLIGFIHARTRIKYDTAIGVVFTTFLATGVIIISTTDSTVDLTSILFGNVLAIRDADLWMTLAVAVIVIVAVIVFYKQLAITSFDPVLATSYGFKTRFIQYALLLGLTLVTVVSVQTVGVILVVALLVTPAATAYQLTNRLSMMVMLSAVFGATSAVTGLFFSFYFNLPSGPAIVLSAAGFFALAFIFSPLDGLIAHRLRTRKHSVHQQDAVDAPSTPTPFEEAR